MLEPDEGEVLIFGRDLWKITEKERYELRTRMGAAVSVRAPGPVFGVFRGPALGCCHDAPAMLHLHID